ncbi:MAG: HipA domain-containing protein [Tenericutes bacterium]|nr:HipA domain-containing protein [Mycoplasmatota bacterium]
MKQINGYIDVNEMLREIGVTDTSLDELKNTDKINLIFQSSTGITFSFKYEGKEYFYKYNETAALYSELVAEELAQDFGIDHVNYYLALFDNHRGCISESYKKANVDYTLGSELLSECYYYMTENRNIEEFNNLEAIWDALEYRYANNPNKDQIISDLMNQIVNMFIFDIIICNYDRHSDNWEIMESSDEIKLSPIYDNEGILTTSGKNAFVSMGLEEKTYSMIWKTIADFQKVSSSEFSDIIKEKLWIISEENLINIFTRIENKTGIPMSDIYKKYYLQEYKSHKNRIEKALTDNKDIRKR